MKRKNIITILLIYSLVYILVLPGCGNPRTTGSIVNSSVPDSEEVVKEPVSEQITESVSEIEEEPLYWAEENGITFTTSKEFKQPTYVFVSKLDSIKEVLDEFQLSEIENTVVVDDIQVSDADEEGYVIYTISSHRDTSYKVEYDKNADIPSRFTFWWGGSNPFPIDYYTGTVFPYVEEHMAFDADAGKLNIEHNYSIDTDVIYDNETYTVSVSYAYNGTWDDGDFKDNGDGKRSAVGKAHDEVIYTIKVPKDYDGLVLAIEKTDADFDPAEFDEADLETQEREAYVLGSDSDPAEKDISGYRYIRVKDILDDFAE